MKTRDITVKDKDGTDTPALLIVCPECDSATFAIYMVHGHQHVECQHCGTSYCGGSCEDAA